MSKTPLTLALVIIAVLAFQSAAASKVVKLTASNFKSQVIDSKELWFIEFFAPWCGHCKNLAPIWEKLANALDGVIKVGAVDMTTDQAAGEPYNVKGFPTLKFFGADKNRPSDYQGDRSYDDLVNTAFREARKAVDARSKGKGSSSSKSSSSSGSGSGNTGGSGKGEAVVLTDSNFDELVMSSDDLWLVEFYAPWCGHCKRLEPEWNRAAAELKGEVKIGKVDATVETKLGSRFAIQGYPTIKLFPGGKKTDRSAEDYNGARDASTIVQFALEKKAQYKPTPELVQLTDSAAFEKNCEKGICLIAFLPHIYDSSASERNTYIDMLKESAKSNRVHPLNFFWSQGGDQLSMEESLNLGSGYPALVAVSLPKKKVSVFRSSFSKKNIDSFINGLVLGKESLYDLREVPKVVKVSAWDGKDHQPTPTSEDEL